jgi:hypothetical protein
MRAVIRPIAACQAAMLLTVCSAAASPGQGPQQGQVETSRLADAAPDCRALAGEIAPVHEAPPWLDTSPRADVEGWQSLAAARFLAGDAKGSLDAWNRADQPRVRCVNLEGLVRTPRVTIIEYLGPSRGQLLTAGRFARVERRLGELAIASGPRLRFDPLAGGVATLTPIAPERDVIPQGIAGWGVVGARTVFLQEVEVTVTSPLGRGEVWTPSYRWLGNRPRTRLRFEVPAPGRLPGILRAQVFAESQTYRFDPLGADIYRQPRQRINIGLSDWITSWLRWEGSTAYDRIDSRSFLALEGSLNARTFGDRVAVILTAGQWSSSVEGASFASGELVATARSTARPEVPVTTVLVGGAIATDSSPLAVWPSLSSGEGRNNLLRAHAVRTDSIITGEAFGREMIFGTLEFEYPIHTRFAPVGVAGFVDAGRAARRLVPGPSPFHVDIGAGVRVSTSGTGKVRLDIGYGLRDNEVELSAGYVVPWGRR